MSDKKDYIHAEKKNILLTVGLIEDLLNKKDLSRYEVIALGKLLQDIYSGIERILRYQLETKGIKIPKTQDWHKKLLLTAKNHDLISDEQFTTYRNLLLFRHMQIHGYGYMLNKERLIELAEPIPMLCREFRENDG